MTLREFVEQNGGFVRNVMDDMQHCSKTKNKINEPDKWHENLEVLYNDYYILLGYIKAACEYGHISHKESLSLEDELQLILTEK